MDAQRALDATWLSRAVADGVRAPARVEPAAIPLDEFHWLAPCPRLFQPDPLGSYKTYDWSGMDGQATVPVDRQLGDRLAARRALRGGLDALRVGWLFIAGPAPDGRQLFHPVVTVPVQVTRGGILGPAHLAPAGDAVLSPAFPTDARRSLTEQLHLGGPRVAECAEACIPSDVLEQLGALRRFAEAAVSALGLPFTRLVPADRPARERRVGGELVVVAGFGVFVTGAGDPDPGPTASLQRWLTAAERRPTALKALLDRDPPASTGSGSERTVDAPIALSATQRRVVGRSRSAALTVVAGVAGTGKTTTAAAVATDAAARGERVLVVARTPGAVDALVTSLLSSPAAAPVAFGSTGRRAAVLARLVETRVGVPVADVAEAAVARERAEDELARRRETVARELRAELAWLRRREGGVPPARATAPGLFGPGADLERAAQLVDIVSRPGAGVLGVRRRARARRQLIRLARARGRPDGAELEAIVDAAVAEAGAAVLEAIGGVDLESAWARLAAVEELARRERARWLGVDARNHDAAGRSRLTILRTIGEVHRALRNDRSRRRLQLAQVSTVRLTSVLPVWVGSLADVDDILPARLGLFDLVVVEEAATTTPVLAAPALLRGARAVVIGDPTEHPTGPGPSVHRLALDRAPTVILDHHFVAPPELVGRALARAVPDVHSARPPGRAGHVETVRVAGATLSTDAVVARVVTARRERNRSVVVITVTPQRATELERALVERVPLEDIERLGLEVTWAGRAATRAADLVVAELLGDLPPDAGPPSVLALAILGRAHRDLVVVHDGGVAAGAVVPLIEDVGAGRSRPGRPVGGRTLDPWTAAVVTVLDEAGFDPMTAWPSGRHVIDVAALRPAGPTAVLTSIHPDGVDAHIDRHLELSGAGWRVIEVFPSRWSERLEKLADHLDNRWRG